jgi:predicted RNA-binding Zn-ribbon protein involved in translation (DUF1610 family)
MIAFPILSLDAELLSPAFGYSFDPRWAHRHESLLSLLWKFVAVNSAPGHRVIRYLDAQADPYLGLQPVRSPALSRTAARLLKLTRPAIAGGLLAPKAQVLALKHLRYCPPCAHRGFHCLMFQLPTVTQCPIHRVSLRDSCPQCKKPLPHELSVRTLEHPYRCPSCGRQLCRSLIKRLDALEQPNNKKVAQIEHAYTRFAGSVLGYPGLRRHKPYDPRLMPKEKLQALMKELYQYEKLATAML